MAFIVDVYCNGCHRQTKLQLSKAVAEKEVRENGTCPHCSIKGKLVYVSSIR